MVSFSFTMPSVDLKNLTFSDQRRKIVSRFGPGIVLSFIVFSVVLFNISFKTPLFQGLHRFGSRSNSTFLSWPFSFSTTSTFSSALNDTSIVRDSNHPVAVNGTLENISDPESKNGTFFVGEEDVGRNGSQSDTNSIFSYLVDSSEKNVKNESINTLQGEDSGENSLVNSVEEHNKIGLKNEASEDKIVYLNSNISSYKECDIFNGRWVMDDKKPYYTPGSCPYVDKDFDCLVNGRPDDMFVKWKWQPYGCDIPTFNATEFLERLRGKKLVFVGDSLNRNMWESLVCLLRHSIPDKKRVYEISGRSEFKKKGFYAFRFEDYN